jgi:hypothetical protein
MDSTGIPGTETTRKLPEQINVYFVPMPDPLPMPNGLTILFQYDDRNTPYVAGFARNPAGPIDLLLRATGPLDIAVRLWLVPSYAISDLMAMAAAVTVAEVVTGTTVPVCYLPSGQAGAGGSRAW